MLPANGVLGLGFGKRAESYSIQLRSTATTCSDDVIRPIDILYLVTVILIDWTVLI